MLDRLVEEDILEEQDGRLSLSEAFTEDVRSNEEKLTDSTASEDPFSTLGIAKDSPLSPLDMTDESFLGEYVALADRIPDASPKELIRWTILLEQFGQGSPPTEGSPEAFLPVSGDKLMSCLKLFSPAIVYVWRHDCDPCDLVRNDFDELLDSAPGDIALFSVYGPDDAELLSEVYGVEGGPTVLFVKDGMVDVRLIGAYHRESLETEIENIRDRT